MKSLISLFVLIVIANCIKFGTYDPYLDPGRIFWAKDTWFNNPIELSQTNAGSSVTLTIHFRPFTSVMSGTVQIIFPRSFSTETNKMATLPNTYNLQAGKDITANYNTILPNSEGIYGPIGIITRHSAGGQIVDANFNFGFIAVTSSALNANLYVSRTSSSTVTKINTDNALKFSFQLTFSLWAHDIIEIVPDSYWTPKSVIACKSVGSPNLLFNSNNANSLPCALGVKSSQAGVAVGADNSNNYWDSVYIYGIAKEVYVSSGSSSNSYTVELDVNTFVSPKFVTSSSSWTINIWRWGTNNLLAKYTTTTGPGSTAGSATFISWKNQNNPSINVMQNQAIFTKVTVGTDSPLPAGSSLTVTFSGVDIYNTVWWSDLDGSTEKADKLCHVTPAIDGASCKATSETTATIAFEKEQAKGSVSFVVLSKFIGPASYVSKITTYYSSPQNVVDESEANPGEFMVIPSSSPNYKIPDVALHALPASTTTYPQLDSGRGYTPYPLYNSNTLNQGGVKGQYIFLRATPGSTNSWGGASGVAASLTFYFNWASSLGFDTFNSVYISSGSTLSDYINSATSLGSSTAEDRTLAAARPATSPKLTSSNQISVSFDASSSSPSVAYGSYYILRFSESSLPFISSNKATFYEIWAIATYTVSTVSTIEIGSSVISVLPQKTSSKLYTLLVCNDQLDGIPMVNYFEPINTDFDFTGQLYAIDIEIDSGYDYIKGFMGTGIMEYDNAGILTINNKFLSSASTATASFITSGAKLTITLKNFGAISVNTPTKVTTYLPSAIATLGITHFSVWTNFYIVKPSDPSVKQILYQSSYVSWDIQKTLKPFDSSSTGAKTSDSSDWYIGDSKGVTISNKLKSSTSATAILSNYIIGIGLSPGFTFYSVPSYSVVVNTAAAATSPASTTYYLSSSGDYGAGGFIMAYGSSWGTATPTSDGINYNLAVANLQSPNHSTSSTWNVWIAAATPGLDCKYSNSYSKSITIQEKSLNSPKCYADTNTIMGASADSVNLSITFEFSINIKVPAGGSLEFLLDSSWSWSSSDYSSPSISASYSIFGNTLTASLYSGLSIGTYTIVVKGVQPPWNRGSYSIWTSCFYSLSTKTKSGDNIESGSSWSPIEITSSASVIPGNSYLTINSYPSSPYAVVDILLDFYFDKKVPAGSYIEISTPNDLPWSYSELSSSIKDYCWANIIYSSCAITDSSTIIMYLAESIISGTKINIYLENAIKFEDPSKTGDFLISAYWGPDSIQIIDGSSGIGKNSVKFLEYDTYPIDFYGSYDITTAGEFSSYTLFFGMWHWVGVVYEDYFYIQFPRDFDPYIGDAKQSNPNDPNSWFLECSSKTLGNPIICTVDHWFVIVKSLKSTYTYNIYIDLTIRGVRNPGPFEVGYFKVWHYGPAGNLRGLTYGPLKSKIPTSPANNMNLKPISIADSTLAASTDYNFDFYLAMNTASSFSTANSFNITFPQQFVGILYTACKLMAFDETSATALTEATWASNCTCKVLGNMISLSPTSTTPIVKTTDRIRISLTNVTNPSSGLTRNTGWDITGLSFGPSYMYWSNKFEIIVVDWTTNIITGRTYGNLNSGYVGYGQYIKTPNSTDDTNNTNNTNPTDPTTDSDPWWWVRIWGNYNSKVIKLFPGQQSWNYYIVLTSGSSNFGLRSQKLILTPKVTSINQNIVDGIKLTSVYHQWTAFQLDEEIAFRISVATGTPSGTCYIEWILTEYCHDGVYSNIYNASQVVTVEIGTQTEKIWITVDPIPTIYVGYTSIPIGVRLGYAPASDLTVTPILGATVSGIFMNPTSLTFGRDTQILFFELKVLNSYDLTQKPVLSFYLAGTDVNSFIIPFSQSLTVGSIPSISSTNLVLVPSGISGTSITMNVKYSQNAIIYWGLTCEGAPMLNFTNLQKQTQNLVSPNSDTLSLLDQLAADRQDTETHIDYAKDTDIASFFRRIHRNHCQNLWADASINRANYGSISITLNWLMDSTSYQFYAYADNKIGTPSFASIAFKTSATNFAYSTSVTFPGALPTSTDDIVRKCLAKNMGVNPDWLISTGRTEPSSSSSGSLRLLENSETISYSRFNYIVVYDRSNLKYSPLFILNNLDQNGATSDLTALIGVPPAAYGVPTPLSPGTIPSWTYAPSLSSKSSSNAIFSAASSQSGLACVSCRDYASDNITYAWQVVDRLDCESNIAYGVCVNTTAATTFQLIVNGLTQDTTYFCYFTVCNSHPINPNCTDYTATAPMASIDIKTDDEAVLIGLLSAFFLIFS